VLTRSIGVLNTWRAPNVTWQAQSNQPWLAVTASGTTGSPLQLTANAGGLADGQYSAQVTVSSSDSSIVNQEVIRVGLTVGSADPQPLIDITGVSAINVVPSPVEPWVFIGGGNAGSSLYVYDSNSGALLHTYSTPFTNVSGLAISGDGLTVFVLETTSYSTQTVWVLDAATGAVQTSYALSSTAPYQTLAYARPDGHAVLLSVVGGVAIDLATGHSFVASMNGPGVSVRADQRMVYMQDTGGSPSTISVYEMRYSNLSGVGLLFQQVASETDYMVPRSNGQDIALSFDGTALYVANGAPYRFDVLDPVTLQQTGNLPGVAYPGNVETCWNGLVATGAQSESNNSGDSIWVYDANGVQQSLMYSGNDNMTARSLRFSGDGTRLINASGDANLIRIQEAPAAP
jgi:WD40 repeat protein